MTIVCQLFQLKVILHEKKSGQVSQSHTRILCLETAVIFSNVRSALCTHFITCDIILKRCLLKGEPLIKFIIFTAPSSKAFVSETSRVILFVCVFLCVCVCFYCEYVVVKSTVMTSIIWCHRLDSSSGVSILPNLAFVSSVQMSRE